MTYFIKDQYLGKSIICLLLGNLLLGVSYIAMLPIWEGFDETAHFSYLQQVADQKKIPLDDKDLLSADIEKYSKFAPIPNARSFAIKPKERLTYKSFFLKSDDFISHSKKLIHAPHESPRKYMPGRGYNWQFQHPPLYYVLLAPAYLATNALSWGKQVFILRITSYGLAWLGLVIAVYTCLGVVKNSSSPCRARLWGWGAIGAGLWPILFPAWFPEMARLGNDSIVCLLLALIWFVSVKMIEQGVSLRNFLLLGFFLSLGCLTKAFFVPLTAGVLSFWLVREWRLRGRDGFLKTLKFSAIVFFAILVSSGWWYWNNYVQYGVALGSIDLRSIKEAGGLWSGLDSNFSFFQWIRSHAAILVMFGWVSGWSYMRPTWIFLLPIALTILLVIFSYLWSIRSIKKISAECFPAWVILPILAGLSYHVLIRLALTGEGRGTPGHYLHILAAPMSLALGLSLCELWGRPVLKALTQTLLSYIILFSLFITWVQSLYFSGIVGSSDNAKIYSFPEQLPPFFGVIEAYERLKIITFPEAGLPLYILGWVSVICGLVFVRRFANKAY